VRLEGTAPVGVALAALATGARVPRQQAEGADEAKTVVPEGGNLVKNADFSSGSSLPWTPSFTPPAEGSASIIDGWYCLDEHAN
jgi:hypothetical protein